VLQRSTIQLLRFHFSLFLLPVYLFALSQVPGPGMKDALLVFLILHLLVYPSSNGYNSYMDRDTTPIGGLQHPLSPTRQLFTVTVAMDMAACLLAGLVSLLFALCILLYILASRAYSYRGIRLKRHPWGGYLTVFLFQGALVFFAAYHGMHPAKTLAVPLLPMLISSFLIGALYPLTQIYQHEADRQDGVVSISARLGLRGSFLFSMANFLAATVLLYVHFMEANRLGRFYLFLLIMLPVVLFFLYWMQRVWRDPGEGSFRNSLRMNIVSTLCTTAFFITLILLRH